MSEIIWTPPESAFSESNLARFALANGFSPRDYDTLHAWSIASPEEFWEAVWDSAGVIGEKGDTIFRPSSEAPMTGATFFPKATLNLAQNLLAGDDGDLAVIAAGESGVESRTTRGELRAMVARCADGLQTLGVGQGDRVGGVLPNSLEALVALLATASIGAVWSSCSPDFGATAILDRLGQIGPKAIFAAPSYRYGGKTHDISGRLREIAAGMDSVVATIRCGEAQEKTLGLPHDEIAFDAFGKAGTAFAPEPMPFNTPVYILYTSGTTGAPKAIVHSAGGVLLQHWKEHALHGDIGPESVLGWYTNTAWMMYHWMVSALACRAAIVLMDGAPIPKTPDGLDMGLLWRVAEETRMTHFGTSPKYLALLQQKGYAPGERHDLSALRSVLSAGAPVTPDQFDWIYRAIRNDMIFASISGGTEILGCFMLGAPTRPVRRGELTAKGLGLAVNVMDDRNAPIVGRRGDLVCTEPFPSMPLTFWGADGHQRYMKTYFADRREIWTHGDVAEMSIHGSAIIHGRSDATLKPGGVRIGTSDIYAVCDRMAELEDSLVFGLPVDGDEEVVLCVKLATGVTLDEALQKKLRAEIRTAASPRHVPHRIVAVSDVPYTLNGKRVESAARSVAQGQLAPNLGSLRNPECLEEFRTIFVGASLEQEAAS